ncbi:energy-coupling factor transporter transmembrane component T family protein [Nocardiopsis composta]|uniref:Energy-coupling factor transport system permease protein n=1 Tax=Nocardiopsis composta TaxID=157465 RepID=A0A7W8QTC5_9ACTN|nr:energy-coupling factor transporter transmembrane component T [Nocardiopsis composta]MBB5436222.1 energy-coupling factor transport system permease protein [Nocardiopsis composta]
MSTRTAPAPVGGTTGREAPRADRRRTGWRSFLWRFDPLAKAAGPLPAMVLVFLTRDPWTPGLFAAAALAAIVLGAGVPLARMAAAAAIGLPLAALLTASFALTTAPELAAGTPILLDLGPLQIRQGAAEVGAATAMRLLALLCLVLVGGLTTPPVDLVRALVQHLKVPYRIGYSGMAAFRFAPRFRRELEIIRLAHRARGTAHRGPLGPLRRAGRMAVPLLAGGVRHGERVALAMDARAFGAHPTRTERHTLRFTLRDALFILTCWTLTALFFWLTHTAGLLAPLAFDTRG